MDNDLPEDDKTIFSPGVQPEAEADDPFAIAPDAPAPDTPAEVDAVMETPAAADPLPQADPPATDTEGVLAEEEDRTLIATPVPPPSEPPSEPAPVASEPPPADPEPIAPAAVPMPPATPVNPNDPVPVGTMINNNYEIKELISAGGMGEVFRGANVFTGDAVAIKIVLQSLANDPKIAALFMREAKVLCGLSDQAIVRYYNFVRDADLDRFCLIMEFIEGVSLSDFVRDERPLTSQEARDLMRKVAQGLDRAHEMDVIHRDLSPDNVMLRDGDVGVPVLIDFGIAKSTEMAESTLHGQLAGKFKYISPEQLGHFGGHIGPRTDIYGLGLLIAAALRGAPLDMGSSIVEAVNARSKIPDLVDIPEDMQPILRHLLEPDPADRPADMASVIRILNDPGALPAKYGGTIPPDQPATIAQELDRTVVVQAPGVSAAPQGLRLPPGSVTAPGGTMGGLSLVPGQAGLDETSASPFGAITGVPSGTQPPVTAVPGLSTPPFAPQATIPPRARRRDRDDTGGAASALRWVLVVLVLAGLGGFVAFQQGLLPQSITGVAPPGAVAGNDASPEAEPVGAGGVTRQSFLAGFDGGPCSLAQRIAAGPDTGTIATFAQREGAFDGLRDGFETAFGTRPAVREHIISDEQCAVLDLARILKTSEAVPPVLTLDSDTMASGGSIVGRLRDRRGRPVWLILITTAGGVYNLTDRLVEQPDGAATFSFGLNATGAGGAEPQLIMAIASDTALIAAAAATNGARAASLLPRVEGELVERGLSASGTVAYFDLLP